MKFLSNESLQRAHRMTHMYHFIHSLCLNHMSEIQMRYCLMLCTNAALRSSFDAPLLGHLQELSIIASAVLHSTMLSKHSLLKSCERAARHFSTTTKSSTVDPAEVAKFASTAARWWHPDGSAAPLHRMNPTRIAYIRSVIEKNIIAQRSASAQPLKSAKPLTGIDVVDVGCGGKLACENTCV